MSRTITHNSTGPVQFGLDTDIAEVTITVDQGCGTASVRLEAVSADDDEAARLIDSAPCYSNGDVFSVLLHHGHGGDSLMSTPGAGQVHIVGDVVTDSAVFGIVVADDVVLGGGQTVVNHQDIGGAGTTIVPGSRGVRAVVTLPSRSAAQVTTQSGAVRATGALTRLQARTQHGPVHAERADVASVHTTSGDVEFRYVRALSAHSVSGRVRVHALTESAQVSTVSGDIDLHAVAASTVLATSVSGDIEISHEPETTVATTLRTVSGRARTARA
ncbi:DUF4097 family beta strand repeat-containing protein [Amycolatopsis magusensis]|uniref:DUF4097 family beta strand repeat-containing protein n=1 Tax=Amycolatopsis magusensis TaxID=882444 RepID=UPI0037924C8B